MSKPPSTRGLWPHAIRTQVDRHEPGFGIDAPSVLRCWRIVPNNVRPGFDESLKERINHLVNEFAVSG